MFISFIRAWRCSVRMHVAVIGSGYVGLTTGACLADQLHNVICVDNDVRKIETLSKGKMPIHEPGLENLVLSNVREGRLTFTADISAVRGKDVVFLCVGTPPRKDGSADVSALLNCAKDVVSNINQYTVIVEKSTVPAGTAEAMKLVARKYAGGKDYDVAVNPEFLREGSAVNDSFHPDRVVIGSNSARAHAVLAELYRPLNAPILLTDMTTAELIKHGSNAFLAMKISYANLIASLAEKVGADGLLALKGIGMDKRIGEEFLKPGIGYGGFCFPKDLAAFIALFRQNGVECGLLEQVAAVNEEQKMRYVRKVELLCNGLEGKTLGVLGLAFKPDTDDMRLAPSIGIIAALQNKGAAINAYDPQAMEKAKEVLKDVKFCSDPYEALAGADALLLLTEWKQFEHLDFDKAKSLLKHPIIADGRDLYRPDRMRALGFTYSGIGRR